MAAERLSPLIRRLRRAADPLARDGPSDAQLLERFVRDRDPAAFELLVWRHGPMVLNVCRRVLRREHDAEDAFQAAFLTLVRKAGAIGDGASLGGWLYKVAYRIALRAAAAARVAPLPARPLPDPSAEEPIAGLFLGELGSALDEEIHRLPDKYRIVFVACCLEGRTAEAAARCLGCPPGTVGTRLARARELLRRRLSRRGFDLSAPGALRGVIPALPAALVEAMTKAALLGTAEKAAAAGVISARAAALTRGALRTMSLTKWMLTSAAVLALGLLGGGAVLLACPRPADRAAPSVAAAPADPKDSGVTLKWRFEKDRPFYQELATETHQTMKVMGKDVSQTQTQTFYFRWTPTSRTGDDWTLTQKIIGVKMDIDLGGSKIAYDTTRADYPKNALSDFFGSLKDAEFTATLDEESKVRKVEGCDEFIKKLSADNPTLGPMLTHLLNDDSLRAMTEMSFAGLPDRRVQPGDSWTRTSKLDLGAAGQWENKFKYTYRGLAGDLDNISVESTLKYIAPAAEASGLPFKIKKADLKCTQSNGFVLFDRETGRIVHTEMGLNLEGTLTIEIGGQEQNVELSQTQRTTLRTTDANPVPSAAPQGDDKKEIERLREENERLRRRLEAVEEALRRDGKP